MKIKSILKVASIAIVILFIISFIGGGVMLKVALKPEISTMQESREYMCKQYPYISNWLDSVEANGYLRDTSIINNKGKRLTAKYMPAQAKTNKTAVILHGYTDDAYRIIQLGYMYNNNLGYNILIPNHQYHGGSEGKNIQMGWKDRLDVLLWMDVANNIFNSQMLVHGISMGGATTMMLSGETPRPYLKCLIEDCGYTSVWDQFQKELKEDFGLPPFPILYTADILCQILYGWGFKEASALKQVKKCTLPMFFIHGTADKYVPTWMVHPLYEAHQNEKELWLVKDAAHAKSYKNNPAEYTQRIRKFTEKYIK